MKTKAQKERQVTVSESTLLSLVADKLNDKVLFPEKVECARQYLNKVKNKDLKHS